VKTVSKSDPVNAEIRQMQKQIADYNARMRRQKQTHIGQAQTAVTAATAFRNLVQRVIDAGAGAAAAPPREKYMGRINPVSSAPALPAPDRSAAEIMAQLRDVVGRDLTDAEREVVAQEVSRTNKQREPDVQEARLHREEDLFKTGGFLSNRRIDTDLLRLRPLDNRFALWQDQHLRQIAHEQEYIGEEFPDWTTSGIVDRETGEPVAVIMYTDGWSSPFPDSVEISQVEVDPQYRGQGLARYLYSLLRRQHNIVSDQDQSPGGAAMWVRMAREGIPVQGWVHFNGNRSPAELDASYDGKYDYEGQLKKLGAREVPGGGRSPLYVFPVKEQNGRLDNLAGTTIRVYQGDFINHWESGLVAPKG
jgi:ribosomal protein S18 acetylase RimI-like enzyme